MYTSAAPTLFVIIYSQILKFITIYTGFYANYEIGKRREQSLSQKESFLVKLKLASPSLELPRISQ